MKDQILLSDKCPNCNAPLSATRVFPIEGNNQADAYEVGCYVCNWTDETQYYGDEETLSDFYNIEDDEFVDLMTEEYKLDEESEAMLCVSITYIRSISVLIE